MSLYIKSVLINFPQEFAKKCELFILLSTLRVQLADMNMVKVVNK